MPRPALVQLFTTMCCILATCSGVNATPSAMRRLYSSASQKKPSSCRLSLNSFRPSAHGTNRQPYRRDSGYLDILLRRILIRTTVDRTRRQQPPASGWEIPNSGHRLLTPPSGSTPRPGYSNNPTKTQPTGYRSPRQCGRSQFSSGNGTDYPMDLPEHKAAGTGTWHP